MNVCSLIGRLTRDPELRYTPNTNQAVITFTIAVDKGLSREKREEMEAKNMPTADFISIVAWGRTAENISNYVSKGNMVGVTGRIQSRTYEAKDGTKRYVTEVIASSVEFLERRNITSQSPNQSHEDYFSSDEDFSNVDEGFAPGSNRDIPF
ncbi:MAG: single-stranded DNA-binding protein [Fenollaria massiliensis]|uniref:Single-stranded DNA-binding protein n=1 Tax=Fenollaria massiliensis TaxID=938288 RepID=A0A9E7IUY8_9FIRM|nr:single-stranded DNA-binding protein [Fenollaria massiliensis]AVM67061.1 single-stranded DNA-binding protein [Peptostreptococcaceae bacterium oral taxon 929]OFK80317.1 single-stranded DNA-binding protein [Anaerosphaera sp. HMSC064C01]UQK59272.1 single-stranded DNA-binding protein [Fenollaria massiliensis]